MKNLVFGGLIELNSLAFWLLVYLQDLCGEQRYYELYYIVYGYSGRVRVLTLGTTSHGIFALIS